MLYSVFLPRIQGLFRAIGRNEPHFHMKLSDWTGCRSVPGVSIVRADFLLAGTGSGFTAAFHVPFLQAAISCSFRFGRCRARILRRSRSSSSFLRFFMSSELKRLNRPLPARCASSPFPDPAAGRIRDSHPSERAHKKSRGPRLFNWYVFIFQVDSRSTISVRSMILLAPGFRPSREAISLEAISSPDSRIMLFRLVSFG